MGLMLSLHVAILQRLPKLYPWLLCSPLHGSISLFFSLPAGYEIAKALSHHGANVIIACRNPAKAAKAVVAIRKGRPQAKVEAMELDLASLSSVKEFSDNYKEKKR